MNASAPASPGVDVARWGQLIGAIAFVAVILLPTPEGMTPSAQRLLAVTALMLTFWLTSAVPIAVTSLIPLSAFPLLGILNYADVSQQYINDSVFLYFGGFVIALGIERWGLHRRIALNIVRAIGTGPRTIVLGFMTASAFLSMWISNTATTLMMLPIALALVSSLREVQARDGAAAEHEALLIRLEIALLLAIAYASSIGGMITTVGTPTNITFLRIFEQQFPDAPPISAGLWISSFLCLGVLFVVCAWAAMTWKLPRGIPIRAEYFRDELARLGSISRGERRILNVFVATALLWVFRKDLDFGFGWSIPGWDWIAQWWLRDGLGLSEKVAATMINDSTVAMFMCVLLFVIPVDRDERRKTRYLMDWETLNRMPWGILLLFGGGFALAEAFSQTQLSVWIGGGTSALLEGQPLWLVIAGVCLVMTFLTEFTTNVATVSALLPVLAAMSVSLGIDPRLIMIPATISTSCAFMLPIATPPNAIVFSSGKLLPRDMARQGLVLNLIGVVLITVTVYWFMMPAMGITDTGLPEWARPGDVAAAR